jgi:hypothetical protein
MFVLKDREFEVWEAFIQGRFIDGKLHCALEILSDEVEHDGYNWAPGLGHEGLVLDVSSWEQLQNTTHKWTASDNPHPEIGILTVFGHEETNNNQIVFGLSDGKSIELEWSGIADVSWNSDYGQDVPFKVQCKLEIRSV